MALWHFCRVTIMLIMILTRKNGQLIELQVDPGDDFTLSVTEFNTTLSTLGDSMRFQNGEKFSTRWESKDKQKQPDTFPHLWPETETRMDSGTGIVQNSEPEDGGTTTAASPTLLGNTLTEGQQLLVTNKSIILEEETEGSHLTVGRKPRWCSCPTELLIPLLL